MCNRFRITILVLLLISNRIVAQRQIPLYDGPIPNAIPSKNEELTKPNEQVDSLTSKVSIPDLTIYLPAKEKANGTAVIICPGGGYGMLLTKREGSDVARAMNRLGVAAFVLKYRLPDDRTMKDRSIGPIQDAQQAIRLVREKAMAYGVDPAKIGIMGFSAGGHLAATAGTHGDMRFTPGNGKTSLRPDFMILINPVISFNDEIGHAGSRSNLLGSTLSPEKIKLFSNELHIKPSTPPTFLVHSGADVVVPVANSLVFYEALLKNKVSAALHIYAKGEHGFLTSPSFDEWFGRCTQWMQTTGLLN